MLAFRPAQGGAQPAASGNGAPRVTSAAAARAALSAEPAPTLSTSPMAAATTPPATTPPATARVADVVVPTVREASPPPAPVERVDVQPAQMDAERWLELVSGSNLHGPARLLAAHAGFIAYDSGVLQLSLAPADEHLKAPNLIRQLGEALATALGGAPQIRFEISHSSAETLHQRSTRERDVRQVAAESAFLADPGVQHLINRHGATLVPDSIRPFDE
jgi:DNA polymerase-3 subunit gamma/tau